MKRDPLNLAALLRSIEGLKECGETPRNTAAQLATQLRLDSPGWEASSLDGNIRLSHFGQPDHSFFIFEVHEDMIICRAVYRTSEATVGSDSTIVARSRGILDRYLAAEKSL